MENKITALKTEIKLYHYEYAARCNFTS